VNRRYGIRIEYLYRSVVTTTDIGKIKDTEWTISYKYQFN